jgi:DNA polymerase III epsilon subunit-like protein
MTSPDNAVQAKRIAFIDLEASGLGSASYPTEIGWAIIREDGSVRSNACLIKPPAKWTIYRNAWSPASERLTGITRDMLDREGLPPGEAMRRFLDGIGDRNLLSDDPDFDMHWLSMLADAAGTSNERRNLGDAKKLIEQAAANQGLTIEFDEPPRHRAEADARRLALTFVRAIASVGR